MNARSFGEALSFRLTAFCMAAYAKGDCSADIGPFRYEPHAQPSPQ